MHDQGVSESVSDWRGVTIHPGAHVLYAVEAGRAASTVEAQVRSADEGPMLTPQGRVWLRVIRRSSGGATVGSPAWVHVAPASLTVLGAPLPHSDAATEADRIEAERRVIQERRETEATHA